MEMGTGRGITYGVIGLPFFVREHAMLELELAAATIPIKIVS
jgi:hypothetical protein